MPLDIPKTSLEVENRAKTDVQRELPGSNPFLKNSVLGAIVTGFSNRVFDFYTQLVEGIKILFPDTTSGSFLTRWAAIFDLQILPASVATGNVIATGTPGASILAGTNLASTDGKIYSTTLTASITANVLALSNLTQSGSLVTATTSSNHGLSNNVPVTVSGAVETAYNITNASITVISATQFTYSISPLNPSSPATGSPQITYNSVLIPIQSVEFGVDQNQDANTVLKLQSPISGVNDSLGVGFGQIGGGSDQESSDALKTRMLERIQNPIAHFSPADITRQARTVPGVTRVFVQEITPAVGQVTILFMRDNDSSPIPAGSEISDVKNAILLIKPANTGAVDVIVSAPVGVTSDFTFTALSPNTISMQNAITANLQQFFAEETNVGENVSSDAYRSAIYNTIDVETNQKVLSFTLSVPSSSISVASGEIAVLGSIVFP